METSKTKKIYGLLVLFMLLSLPVSLSAQHEEIKESKSVSISTTSEGKVKLKVIMKEGNDETTFEKTYDSHEEMYNDPDLDKYGIDLGFGSSAFGRGRGPRFFLHQGPGSQFWNDDAFGREIEELRKEMEEMMSGFGGSGFFFNADPFMDMDSLMQSFQFKNDNGKFFFNGEEITDLDSLQKELRERFGQFDFGFDFDDFGSSGFGQWSDEEKEDVKVIRRAKVYVRSAHEEDKALVGTEEKEALRIKDISFYPNPSDGRFDIELVAGDNAPVQFVIVDAQGNEVFNKLVTPRDGYVQQEVDLSRKDKGIYVLKVTQGKAALTKRLIVE